MRWECSECGGFTTRDRRPVRCGECGTAGVIFVEAEVANEDELEGDDLRARWLQVGLDQASAA